MQFAVADEAAALRDAAEVVLQALADTALIRSAWGTGQHAGVRDVWQGLADVGLTGALVPEAAGGLGLDEDALVPVLQRVGYSGLPGPAVETVAVAAPLLAAAGHAALPDLLSGAALVTVYLGTGHLGTAASAGEPVPYLQMADYVLLRGDDDAVRLFAVGDIDTEPVRAVDGSRQLARLRVTPAGGTVIATGADAAWQRGVLGTAAMLVGLAERMLAMTVDYVGSRRQFGVPVGSFQAIKHRLADAYVGVEFARPAVLAAGWALAAAAPDADEQTSMAKVLASDAATAVAAAALQCHGAIGYTTEYDLHLFAKRAWALAASWGSASWHRRRLAAILGLTREEGEPRG
jgi:alkylation response protein AidB-like acyl-CoA dehydrogenase